MQNRNLNNNRMIMILLTLLGISFQSFATSFDPVKSPLQETNLVLAFHRERLAQENGTYSLIVRCYEPNNINLVTFNNCPILEFYRVYKADKKLLPQEEILGHIKYKDFPALLATLIQKYDASYNPSPLILGAASGFIVGVALGEISAAITLGVLGAGIDIVKSPITLPYTAFSKLHRLAQRKNLSNRFEQLLKNKKFKPTRILGNMQFHNMANSVLDFCAINGKNLL